MKIEILYFDGCPNYRPAAARVNDVLKEEGLTAEIVGVNVPDEATAKSLGFPGSPTIRINGLDVEPSARSTTEFGMMCRTYTEGGKRSGLPPRELIRSAVREAAQEAGSALACCELPRAEVSPRQDSHTKGRGLLWGAAVGVGAAASLCCILPVLAAVSGLGVLASAAFFAAWRPYLLGVTGALLIAGGIRCVP